MTLALHTWPSSLPAFLVLLSSSQCSLSQIPPSCRAHCRPVAARAPATVTAGEAMFCVVVVGEIVQLRVLCAAPAGGVKTSSFVEVVVCVFVVVLVIVPVRVLCAAPSVGAKTSSSVEVACCVAVVVVVVVFVVVPSRVLGAAPLLKGLQTPF